MTGAWAGGTSGGLLPAALVAAVATPAVAVTALAGLMWFDRARSERLTRAIVASSFTVVALACALLAGGMVLTGHESIGAEAGPWFGAGEHTFTWQLSADAVSVPFALVAAVLIGLTGAVSARYLHREPGFARFHLLLLLFGGSVELTVLAGDPPALYFGWELVGLTSALLIAFFVERRAPVRHGLRAFLTYRAGDAGLLVAAIWIGQLASSPDGGDPAHADGWDAILTAPGVVAHAPALCFLLLAAVLAKSALIPVGGWLPRAMEGPTPSSAVFYGAVSIHLGPYLLLRAEPLFAHAPAARVAVVLVGALTALHATVVSRAQSDVKSGLAYGSMTQVGLIVAEIGLGLHTLALTHILVHATLRCAQILRSPSALRDSQRLEQAQSGAPTSASRPGRITPARWQPRLYRYAFERGDADVVLRQVGGAAARALTAIDRWQRQAAGIISGGNGTALAPAHPATAATGQVGAAGGPGGSACGPEPVHGDWWPWATTDTVVAPAPPPADQAPPAESTPPAESAPPKASSGSLDGGAAPQHSAPVTTSRPAGRRAQEGSGPYGADSYTFETTSEPSPSALAAHRIPGQPGPLAVSRPGAVSRPEDPPGLPETTRPSVPPRLPVPRPAVDDVAVASRPAAGPASVEPVDADPATVELVAVELVAVELVAVDGAAVEPPAEDPGMPDPAAADPAVAEPMTAEAAADVEAEPGTSAGPAGRPTGADKALARAADVRPAWPENEPPRRLTAQRDSAGGGTRPALPAEDRPRFPTDVRPVRPRAGGPW
ncbi:NADH/ubiquinone/plastoquinone (complex I) [Parafrankia colletiae]|uniref:NADH/ubiquinone/plastoquinone (Complex I) n=1 Tax=Parafrankia colletiae TaxID=573497 RepID=A0A1S1QQK7_9ACTN|nr:proton-conducting transporter membrane subunit [Parafrankia colletiae]MCK9902763.1 NADH/ubiquinone/plastoquinone (complex I) [Frankia sp. Cpl3]OHV35849.1 NADH/ubiquinone/plastoquinone (complex I) [Parafrankia colletiae]